MFSQIKLFSKPTVSVPMSKFRGKTGYFFLIVTRNMFHFFEYLLKSILFKRLLPYDKNVAWLDHTEISNESNKTKPVNCDNK